MLLGRFMVKLESKMNWKEMAILSSASVVGLLVEALLLRFMVGHTGIDSAFMMLPTVFCILGFLISFTVIPSGTYSIFLRNMSVLVFMSQRLFLTVIPGLLSSNANQFIFDNIYFGALIVCGTTILFSVAIILLTKKVWIFKASLLRFVGDLE